MGNLFKSFLIGLSALLLVACSDEDSGENNSSITVNSTTEVFVGNIAMNSISVSSNSTSDTPMKGDTIIISPTSTMEKSSLYNQNCDIQIYLDNILIDTSSWSIFNCWSYGNSIEYDTSNLNIGEHTVKVIADPDNKVNETNENDNEATGTFTLIEYAAPTVNLTSNNITLDSTTYAPFILTTDDNYDTYLTTNPSSGDTVYARFDFICTGGDADSFTITSYLNSEKIGNSFALFYSDGKVGSLHLELNSDLVVGTNTIKIVIDSFSEVRETNENDNTFEFTFTIDS